MQTPTFSSELLADFSAALNRRIAGELRTDPMTRVLYATDASMYQIMPVGVLFPREVDDVQAALEETHRFGIPVLPRGAGSSLAGQTVGTCLVIDFSRHLNQLLEFNEEERWVRVQPGLVLDWLSATIQPRGLKVGPDPASSNRATLGGMMANNATGTHSILYGNIIHHVREAHAYLADGSPVHFRSLSEEAFAVEGKTSGSAGRVYRELAALLDEGAEVIRRDTPRHWRRNSGYRLESLLDGADRNLARLLCGSEGTLGVITDLTLSLVPMPRRTALGIVHFQTRRESLLAATTILETKPSAVELFDGVAIRQARLAPGFARQMSFITGDPGSVLITEYSGDSENELVARLDELEQTLKRTGHGYAVVRAMEAPQIKNVWNIRNEGLGLIMSVKGDYKPTAFIEDASVPVEHLADYIDDLVRLLEETKTDVAMYAHASAGTLHVRPFINTKDAVSVQKMRDIALGSMQLVRKFGGAVSSEHGDGLARSWLNEALLGPELYALNRKVKSIFDPDDLLNPGKVVNAPPMTENLRMGPSYHTMPVETRIDFSADGGFAASIELCNGNGACRKTQSGTMCPSYMVTRDEEQSTRGRANALRAALSGNLPDQAFTSPRLFEVLELCVQCKGCKTECPSNVDMARIKTEWLDHYWKEHDVPLRTRLFANLPALTRSVPSRLAATANWFNGKKSVRKILEKQLGISAKRKLPSFAPVPFSSWFARQDWPEDGPTVVLFADTFNNYNYPETSRAAAEFLSWTGHHVVVPEAKACCGRTYLSKGLLDEARKQALQAVEILYPYAEQDLPIVGLEPSCILTFRDEFPALFPDDARVKKIAENTLTFEEFVAQSGTLAGVTWKEDRRNVLVHGHCHQKAIVGNGPSERCLSLPTNYSASVIDSGCCGMAGAFGYETEHYDVSIKMAEHRLAPAIRQASGDTIIAAAGVSCRSQIEDTTGRKAYHPAEILRDALKR